MKDKNERKHRRTTKHPGCVEVMANACFDDVPTLSEAMGLQPLTQIWFVEDVDGEHGYGRTRTEAEAYVSGNRGYDSYDGSSFAACLDDGWAQAAVRIVVPRPVADTLLGTCVI